MSKVIIPEALRWFLAAGVDLENGRLHPQMKIMMGPMFCILILETLQIFDHFNDIDVIAGVIEVLAPVYLSFTKVLMIIHQRSMLVKILNNIKGFLSTDTHPETESIESMFVTVKTMLSVYRWLAVTTTTMIITLKPILTGNGGFPIDIWQPFNMEVTPYYQITYFLESCVGYFATFTNIAFDSLYVAYITHLISQVMIVKHLLRNLPFKRIETKQDELKCWEDMKRIIEYHIHLMSVIESIQYSHSFIFFNIIGSSTLTVCIDLYSVASSNGSLDILRIVKYTFQCSFFVFLLFAYCFTGNQLTHQCLSISDAMYESDWYVHPLPRIRKGVLLVIQRTQKPEKLNAGGLLELNLENFIKTLRLAFSVFTLIRTQTKKNV